MDKNTRSFYVGRELVEEIVEGLRNERRWSVPSMGTSIDNTPYTLWDII